MKIIEYKTAKADSLDNLDKAVNALIKEGFQPYKNPYLVHAWLCQAMVKNES